MIDRVGIEIMCRFYGDVACCTRSAELLAKSAEVTRSRSIISSARVK